MVWRNTALAVFHKLRMFTSILLIFPAISEVGGLVTSSHFMECFLRHYGKHHRARCLYCHFRRKITCWSQCDLHASCIAAPFYSRHRPPGEGRPLLEAAPLAERAEEPIVLVIPCFYQRGVKVPEPVVGCCVYPLVSHQPSAGKN